MIAVRRSQEPPCLEPSGKASRRASQLRPAPGGPLLAALAALTACTGSSSPGAPATQEEQGGGGGPACVPAERFAPGRFFRVEVECGRPTLVSPAGERFYSTGVNHVSWDGDASPAAGTNPYRDAVLARYGTEEAWADATAARLASWGWSTVGAWSSHDSLGRRMPHTRNLKLAAADWQTGELPDYFSAQWAAQVEELAEAGIGAAAQDPNLVGWFIDNELHWGPDWRASTTLFDEGLRRGPETEGKQALVALLSDRHGGDVSAFNAAWGTELGSFDELGAVTRLPREPPSEAARADRSAFLVALATRFFAVTTGAIRSRDPDHLVLGVRFVAALVPVEVAQVAGIYLDVVSVNAYEFVVSPAEVWPPEQHGYLPLEGDGGTFLAPLHVATGRPLLVTEFGFRAADSGLPNSWPPIYPVLATQAERADRFEAYARRCQGAPWIVGYHWFEWADQPATGRFDGEDNNWGLVTEADDPYELLVQRTAAVNALVRP